jgi:DNA-binding CsgD family transcriptional regulator
MWPANHPNGVLSIYLRRAASIGPKVFKADLKSRRANLNKHGKFMPKLDDTLLIELIDQVYAAAIDTTRWEQVTQSLGAAFSARYSLIFGFEPSTSRVLYATSWGLPADVLARYESTFAALDIRMPAALQAPTDTVVTDEALIDRSIYVSSQIYNEYLHPLDLERLMAVLPHNSSGTRTIVSVNRPSRTGTFERCEREFMQRLVPHLQRALLMSAKLAKATISNCLSEEVMTRMHFGVVLLGPGGTVISVNPVAEALLRARDALMQSRGRLIAVERGLNDQLQRAIADAERIRTGSLINAAGTVVCPRPGSHSRLYLLVAPLPAEAIDLHGTAPLTVVFIFDETARPTIEPANLSFLYGISPAEARVAAKLAEGYQLGEIAQTFSLSIETVRTHVKHLLIKFNCGSQAMLIREILLGPVLSMSRKSWRGQSSSIGAGV